MKNSTFEWLVIVILIFIIVMLYIGFSKDTAEKDLMTQRFENCYQAVDKSNEEAKDLRQQIDFFLKEHKRMRQFFIDNEPLFNWKE